MDCQSKLEVCIFDNYGWRLSILENTKENILKNQYQQIGQDDISKGSKKEALFEAIKDETIEVDDFFAKFVCCCHLKTVLRK